MRMNLGLLIVVAVVIGAAAAGGANVYASSSLQDYSDEFDSPVLDPKWTFENPAPNPEGQSWSLTSNPGFLTMTTTGPTDLWGGINTSPKMLQNAPDGDCAIEMRVLADPDASNEHAGILVIESPTSWVRIIRDSRYNCVFLQAGPSTDVGWISTSASDVILKLTKLGSTYEGAFSTDGGFSFMPVGQAEGPADPVSIGTTIASTPDGNVFTAEFDYFRVDATPLQCDLVVSNLPSDQISIHATASGDLSDLTLRLHIYDSYADCDANNPESSETLDAPQFNPPIYREYDETFVRVIPAEKWYKVELLVHGVTDDTCEKWTVCSIRSGHYQHGLNTTSPVAIASLILLLALCGGVLIKRARLA